MNEILEYFAKLLEMVKKHNPQKAELYEKHEDDLIRLIIKEGLKNFYASKIKLYIDEDYDEIEREKELEKQRQENRMYK
jgi:hypothetical protein